MRYLEDDERFDRGERGKERRMKSASSPTTRSRERLPVEWMLIPLGVVSALAIVFGLRAFL